MKEEKLKNSEKITEASEKLKNCIYELKKEYKGVLDIDFIMSNRGREYDIWIDTIEVKEEK